MLAPLLEPFWRIDTPYAFSELIRGGGPVFHLPELDLWLVSGLPSLQGGIERA